jgi:hypothetical protein
MASDMSVPPEEEQHYDLLAVRAKEEYTRAKPNYRYQPASNFLGQKFDNEIMTESPGDSGFRGRPASYLHKACLNCR